MLYTYPYRRPWLDGPNNIKLQTNQNYHQHAQFNLQEPCVIYIGRA